LKPSDHAQLGLDRLLDLSAKVRVSVITKDTAKPVMVRKARLSGFCRINSARPLCRGVKLSISVLSLSIKAN
jgi:hypothetical protein